MAVLRAGAYLGVVFALFLGGSLQAQEPEGGVSPAAAESTEPEAAVSPVDELALRQTQLADQYKRMEDLLFKMAEVEATSNPRRAALLKQAFNQSKERLVKLHMEKAAELLSQKRVSDALSREEEVQKELSSLLELLLTEIRPERLKDEMTRIKEYIKEVERIKRIQQGIRGRNEGGADPQRLAEEQGKAAERAGELAKQISENEEGGGKTDGEPKDGDDAEKQEGDMPEGDEKAPEGQEKSENAQPGDSTEGQPKAGQPQAGESSEGGKKQEGAQGEPGNDQKKPSSKASGEPQEEGAKKEPGENSEGQPKDGEPKEKMPQEGEPQEGEPNEGGEPSQEGQQGEQGQESEKSKPSQKSQQGQPKQQGQQGQQGEQDQQQQDDQQQPQQDDGNPARKRIQAAEEKMRQAQRKLEEAKRKESVEDQRQAERELERAIAELEEILRQLREEEIERMLAMLEGRFAKMLEMQLQVYEKTRGLNNLSNEIPQDDKDRWDREVGIPAGRLSSEERRILVEADKALLLLQEEGSSVAFPETVEQMRDDMDQVVNRLAAAKPDKLTLGIEEDIIAALQDMIEALQQAQQDMEQKQQQQQQQQQEPGDQPLVDQLAELKMIRALQDRVRKRTVRYAGLLDDEEDPVGQAVDDELRTAIRKLAERQQSIFRVTRDIVIGKNQ